MVALTTGSVVLVPFPFSDLSEAKLRPAIVLADAGRNDWILSHREIVAAVVRLLQGGLT